MKILVTLSEKGNLNSTVCPHFGHCTHFLIVDERNGKIEKYSAVENKASHGGGGCQAVDEALQYGIDAVISGGMGLGAQQKLIAAGVKLFGFSGTAQEALNNVFEEKASGIAPCPGQKGNSCHH